MTGHATRRAALNMLTAILCNHRLLHEAEAAEQQTLERLTTADRALTTQLVRTVLRRHGQLQHLLDRLLHKPLPKRACRARAALMLGAAQLLFLRTPAHAAIHTTVELLKAHPRTRPLAGLANAVLRRLQREGDALLRQAPPTLNFPDWLRRRWREQWGEEAVQAMAEELLREPPLDITVKRPGEAPVWAERLDGLPLPTGTVRIEKPARPVASLPGHAEGAWWVQDAAATLPARLAGNVTDRMVADLCAAPGGKTMQLAAAGAQVTAVDISAPRLARLRENLTRTGLTAEIVQSDVLNYTPVAPFDVVLLDAPCTATGTFRRHPDVLLNKTPEQAHELVALQERMLEHVRHLVAPGGLLIYCVCSLLPEEGEEQVARFLARHGDAFARDPVRLEENGGLREVITQEGDVRTLPHFSIGETRGLDGFFIARLRRIS